MFKSVFLTIFNFIDYTMTRRKTRESLIFSDSRVCVEKAFVIFPGPVCYFFPAPISTIYPAVIMPAGSATIAIPTKEDSMVTIRPAVVTG